MELIKSKKGEWTWQMLVLLIVAVALVIFLIILGIHNGVLNNMWQGVLGNMRGGP